MTEPTTGPTAQADGITDEDRALFEQAANEGMARWLGVLQESCLEAIVLGRKFPLAEPEYNARRPLALDAFEAALAGFKPERARAIDALLAARTVPEIRELMAGGKLSSVELVTYYVDRIRRYDVDKLNSVIELNPEALTIAAQLDREQANGKARGPLHGIPVLLKDNIATGDQMHTTAGAYALKDWRADRDAFLVRKLRAAGAIILGKANLSEWANYMDPCMPSGFSAVGGQTRHPYGAYDPLGSSSGSAVSVAAHLTTVSVGSETSGSIIQPSRVNSVVALRPSQGLISRDHVIPLGSALDTPGPDRSLADRCRPHAERHGRRRRERCQDLGCGRAGRRRFHPIPLPGRGEEAARRRHRANPEGQSIPGGQGSAASGGAGPGTDAEEQTALLYEEVLPDLGGDPEVAIKALKAEGIAVVEIADDTLPAEADTAQPLLALRFPEQHRGVFRRGRRIGAHLEPGRCRRHQQPGSGQPGALWPAFRRMVGGNEHDGRRIPADPGGGAGPRRSTG